MISVHRFIQITLLSTGLTLFLCAYPVSRARWVFKAALESSQIQIIEGSRAQILDSVRDPSLIVPGERVGPLGLDDTKEHFWQVFQRHDPGSSEYPHTCGAVVVTELHWADVDDNGVFAYLRNGRIFEISSASRRFHGKSGLTAGSTPQDVRRSYPDLQAYWLAHIRDLATGNRDFIYWVGQTHGIAFAFYYDQQLRKRRVFAIYVFEPKNAFVPLGCLLNPLDWRKLQPYSLEPPDTSHSD
jgi:hypothetical protein